MKNIRYKACSTYIFKKKKNPKQNSLYWVPPQLGQASGHRPLPASAPESTLSAGGEKWEAEVEKESWKEMYTDIMVTLNSFCKFYKTHTKEAFKTR